MEEFEGAVGGVLVVGGGGGLVGEDARGGDGELEDAVVAAVGEDEGRPLD